MHIRERPPPEYTKTAPEKGLFCDQHWRVPIRIAAGVSADGGAHRQKPARLQLASTWSKFGSSIVKTFAQSSRMELSKVFTRSISMN